MLPCCEVGMNCDVEWAAGTPIKPENGAALPDDGVPVQAVKQSTPLMDGLTGPDGGNHSSAIVHRIRAELGSAACTPSHALPVIYAETHRQPKSHHSCTSHHRFIFQHWLQMEAIGKMWRSKLHLMTQSQNEMVLQPWQMMMSGKMSSCRHIRIRLLYIVILFLQLSTGIFLMYTSHVCF